MSGTRYSSDTEVKLNSKHIESNILKPDDNVPTMPNHQVTQ
jgi:hypothetical protein